MNLHEQLELAVPGGMVYLKHSPAMRSYVVLRGTILLCTNVLDRAGAEVSVPASSSCYGRQALIRARAILLYNRCTSHVPAKCRVSKAEVFTAIFSSHVKQSASYPLV